MTLFVLTHGILVRPPLSMESIPATSLRVFACTPTRGVLESIPFEIIPTHESSLTNGLVIAPNMTVVVVLLLPIEILMGLLLRLILTLLSPLVVDGVSYARSPKSRLTVNAPRVLL